MYLNQLKISEGGALKSLQGISRTLSLQISGDSLESVFTRYPLQSYDTVSFSSNTLKNINTLLHSVQVQNNLSTPIYTLTYDDTNDDFFVGAASNGQEPYGFHYTSPPAILKQLYYTGGTIPPFEDDHGTWLSALHPIKNSKGAVVAALQVDFPFDDFIMYARDDLKRNIGVSFVFFLIIGVVLFFFLRQILNEEELVKQSLENARHELEQSNSELLSSIEYARSIQENIYPEAEELKGFFDEYVIFNRPRDIVSGDFYWFLPLGQHKAILAVGDCTGHGVPGALMSVMGHNFLNEAVLEKGLRSPKEILEFLDEKIKHAFGNNGKDEVGTDGMDIGLCFIDKQLKILTFSGARMPLTIIRNEEVAHLNGARRGIGESFLATTLPFENEQIEFHESNMYFLYSDGLQDQFGGERSRKLKRKGLIPWLKTVSIRINGEQHPILESLFNQWMGDNDQVDDVCLVGFRV